MAQADIIGAIVAILKADAGVVAEAGDNVFGGELPKNIVSTTLISAVLVQPSGGVSLAAGTFSETDTQRFDLYAHGQTLIEANGLRALCRMAVCRTRRQVVAGCLIHWIKPAGGFSTGRDPDTSWPSAFQSFQVLHALEEVA